ncbi:MULTISPECIES: hypothetical protein [unclassified Blastococcus]
MTTPGPDQPQPRDIALEQPPPEQLEELEAASEPEADPAGEG